MSQESAEGIVFVVFCVVYGLFATAFMPIWLAFLVGLFLVVIGATILAIRHG